MIRITVAGEQAEKLRQCRDSVELFDEKGNVIGCYSQAFSGAEITEAKHRSAMERGGRTTSEVLDRLSQLESQ